METTEERAEETVEQKAEEAKPEAEIGTEAEPAAQELPPSTVAGSEHTDEYDTSFRQRTSSPSQVSPKRGNKIRKSSIMLAGINKSDLIAASDQAAAESKTEDPADADKEARKPQPPKRTFMNLFGLLPPSTKSNSKKKADAADPPPASTVPVESPAPTPAEPTSATASPPDASAPSLPQEPSPPASGSPQAGQQESTQEKRSKSLQMAIAARIGDPSDAAIIDLTQTAPRDVPPSVAEDVVDAEPVAAPHEGQLSSASLQPNAEDQPDAVTNTAGSAAEVTLTGESAAMISSNSLDATPAAQTSSTHPTGGSMLRRKSIQRVLASKAREQSAAAATGPVSTTGDSCPPPASQASEQTAPSDSRASLEAQPSSIALNEDTPPADTTATTETAETVASAASTTSSVEAQTPTSRKSFRRKSIKRVLSIKHKASAVPDEDAADDPPRGSPHGETEDAPMSLSTETPSKAAETEGGAAGQSPPSPVPFVQTETAGSLRGNSPAVSSPVSLLWERVEDSGMEEAAAEHREEDCAVLPPPPPPPLPPASPPAEPLSVEEGGGEEEGEKEETLPPSSEAAAPLAVPEPSPDDTPSQPLPQDSEGRGGESEVLIPVEEPLPVQPARSVAPSPPVVPPPPPPPAPQPSVSEEESPRAVEEELQEAGGVEEGVALYEAMAENEAEPPASDLLETNDEAGGEEEGVHPFQETDADEVITVVHTQDGRRLSIKSITPGAPPPPPPPPPSSVEENTTSE